MKRDLLRTTEDDQITIYVKLVAFQCFSLIVFFILLAWLALWVLRTFTDLAVLFLDLTRAPGAPTPEAMAGGGPAPVFILFRYLVFSPQSMVTLPLALVGAAFTVAIMFLLVRTWVRWDVSPGQRLVIAIGLFIIGILGESLIQHVSPDVIYPRIL